MKRQPDLAPLGPLLDALPVLLALYDPALEQLQVNRAFTTTLGWTEQDIATRDVMTLCYPDPAVRARVAEFMAAPDGAWLQIPTTASDGRVVPVLWTNVRIANDRQIGIGVDLTEREAAQQRAAFLASASAVLAESLDEDAVLRTVARLAIGTAETPGLADACTITLATPDEAREGRWRTMIEGRDPERVAIEIERQRRFPASPNGPRGFPAVIRTGRSELVTPAAMEEQLRAVALTDGVHRTFFDALDLYTAVSAPLIARGRILGAITLVRHGPFDTADLALAEDLARRAALALDNARLYATAEQSRAEAEAARADAEAASRAKSEFLAVMSHELRTPLNAIGGYAELLELGVRGPLTDQQRADLARIHQSQRHLLGLINQVLNYTRIDAGAVTYELGDVLVSDAIAAAAALVHPQVQRRDLTFTVAECAPGLLVHADPEKVQQILLNLLTNAVKFTPPGGEIRVACEECDAADGVTDGAVGRVVTISVADDGIGIPDDKLAAIFDPFVQVDQRLTRTQEGVGLGLAISRDLARGMGGDLVASSTIGGGSVFTLRLRAGLRRAPRG
jgi:PAS domain S-box-containing protein